MIFAKSILSFALILVSLAAMAGSASAGPDGADIVYRCMDTTGMLLEYSPDTNPLHRAGKEIDSIVRQAVGRDKHPGNGEPVYAGAATYLLRYPVLDSNGNTTGYITLDIRTREIVDGKLAVNDQLPAPSPVPSPGEFSYHIIQDFPVLPYFITEGATAAAALIVYWDQRYSLKLNDCRDRTKLVLSMTEAGCGCKLDELLTKYMAARGRKITTRHFVWPAGSQDIPLTFEALKQEIDAGHPGILVIAAHGLKRILTVCGYRIDPYGCYVVVREQGYRGEQNPPESCLFINWQNLRGKLEFIS